MFNRECLEHVGYHILASVVIFALMLGLSIAIVAVYPGFNWMIAYYKEFRLVRVNHIIMHGNPTEADWQLQDELFDEWFRTLDGDMARTVRKDFYGGKY